MFSKANSLAFLAIFSACFNLALTFEHDITTHNLTHGDFVQDKDFFASPGLVYGSCHNMETRGERFTAKCTFVMETSKPVDSADHLRTCDFDLNTKVKQGEYLSLKRVVALSEDKAVVVLEAYDTYRYFVLHFAYAEDVPCKGFRVSVERDIKALVFAPQPDKFEIVATEGENCELGRRCRMIFDMRGHVHEAAHGWLHNDQSNLIAVVDSPYVERLVVDEHDSILRLYVADHLGLQRLIKEYSVAGLGDDNSRFVSATYELVSMCTKNRRTLICSQYNLYSEKVFETELMYTQFSTVNLMKVHNAKNGGLILVLGSCSNKHSDFCEDDILNFYVTKTDATGRQIGTVKVDKSARVAPEKLHYFEDQDGKMCLSHVFNDWRSDDTTVVDVFCFSDDDFRKGSLH